MHRHTPLHARHRALGARMVPFAGWSMPLHYGSQIREHRAVRAAAGMFDVSHMQIVDLEGVGAQVFLRRLLANDVVRLEPGQALYSCMLNPAGGVLDDLICYLRGPDRYRLVVNAATAERDLAWMHDHLDPGLELHARADLAMLAVQGPEALTGVIGLLPPGDAAALSGLRPFHALETSMGFIARTGYTGEDGCEIILPVEAAPALWDALLQAGVTPCGLGARDSLRLEAGMNLYGNDMDETTTPLESGLAWTLSWKPRTRAFIGRPALERQQAAGVPRRQMGLVLEGKGVLRAHQPLYAAGQQVGEITSGGFAPTLGTSIALARVAADAVPPLEVEIRGRRHGVRAVKPPFVRHGRILV